MQLCIAGGASAQYAVGTPVDRNVADTGANSYSMRFVQPGIGQFGVGSLLLDRYGQNTGPFQPDYYDPYAGDTRAGLGHRYMLQAPGFHALMDRPDYIGPSPTGGWVRNAQTYDGAEILTLRSANTVYVLSPELLEQRSTTTTEAEPDNPYRVQLRTAGDPYAIMRNAQVDGRADAQPYQPAAPLQQITPADENYVHPEIIERRKRLKAEREAEKAAKQAAQQQEQSTPEP